MGFIVKSNGIETIDAWISEITSDLEGVGVHTEDEPSELLEYGDDDIEIVECAPVHIMPRERQLVRVGFLYATIAVSLLCAATTFLGV